MGGIGSGGNNGREAKRTVESTPALDLRELRRLGLLKPGPTAQLTWTRRGATQASALVRFDDDGLDFRTRRTASGRPPQDIHERIQLTRIPQHYGGHRYALLCPGCGHRRVALYLVDARIRCRVCHGLNHASQHDTPHSRTLRRAHKIRARLGGPESLFEPIDGRPRGMSRKVFLRLLTAELDVRAKAFAATSSYLDRLRAAGAKRAGLKK